MEVVMVMEVEVVMKMRVMKMMLMKTGMMKIAMAIMVGMNTTVMKMMGR